MRPWRVGQPLWPARRERGVRHALGPQRMAQERPYRRQLAPDRRRRKLPRPRAAELGGVLRQRAHVDVLEPRPAGSQPVAELLDVVPVCTAGPLGERRAFEEPLDLVLHRRKHSPPGGGLPREYGLRDGGDDLVAEAREALQELGPLGLEALDQGPVLVSAALLLVQTARLQDLRLVDP